jgi:hypothetical protein
MRWLFVLALVGCGLGPTPSTSAPVSTNGTGPWTDYGPAQVCLGDETLGPADADPAGFCASNDLGELACLADTDCGSREACACGRCVVPYCTDAADCDAPRTCNFAQHRCDLPCTSNFICGDVAQCIGGVCRGRCAVTADCQHGEICNAQHTCVVDECNGDSACATGQHCAIQRVPQQVLEPAPLAAGPGVVLYLDLATPSQPDVRAIWRAESTDGLHFQVVPNHAVVDEPLSARAPAAVVANGITYLYYEQGDGEAIRVVTSMDGITFGSAATVLPGPDVHAPAAALLPDGTLALYYERGDGNGIGLATGLPQSPLTDHGIVLAPADVEVGDGTPGTAFWIHVQAVKSPHALLVAPEPGTPPTLQLWFSAFGIESAPAMQFGDLDPMPPNYSIGYAAADPASPATLTVWPYGPVVDRVQAFLDHDDDLQPAALPRADGSWLLYDLDATPASTSAVGPDGPFTIGRIEIFDQF